MINEEVLPIEWKRKHGVKKSYIRHARILMVQRKQIQRYLAYKIWSERKIGDSLKKEEHSVKYHISFP